MNVITTKNRGFFVARKKYSGVDIHLIYGILWEKKLFFSFLFQICCIIASQFQFECLNYVSSLFVWCFCSRTGFSSLYAFKWLFDYFVLRIKHIRFIISKHAVNSNSVGLVLSNLLTLLISVRIGVFTKVNSLVWCYENWI